MITSKDKTIGGVSYTVTQFPARRGLLIQAKLAKVLGPLLGGALDGVSDVGGENDINIGKALGALSSLNPTEFCTLALELLTSTRRNGVEITEGSFDLDFAGAYKYLYQVLLFSIEVNFGDFFGAGGIGGLSARLLKKPAPPAAASPTA